jgi:hypothetical protein
MAAVLYLKLKDQVAGTPAGIGNGYLVPPAKIRCAIFARLTQILLQCGHDGHNPSQQRARRANLW